MSSSATNLTQPLNGNNNLILYNDSIGYYQTTVFNLEITNESGNCLILNNSSVPDSNINFNITSSGHLDIIASGNEKKINIVNHNGIDAGLSLGGTLVTVTANELNKLSGMSISSEELTYLDTTKGIAEANKALIVDENRNISNIHNLQTDNLIVNGTLVTSTATELNYNDIVTIGKAESAKVLVVDADKNISEINNLSANYLSGELQTSEQPNITSVGTLTTLNTNELKINNILISASPAELNVLDGLTATTAELNLLDGVTATTDELNTVDITTKGIAEANKVLIVDENRNISNIHNLEITNLIVDGTLLTASATKLNYNDITTIGIAEPDKALIVDIDKNISEINNLSAVNLTGTLQTSAQPNITSVGVLTSLDTNELKINNNTVTANANELNVLDGITSTTNELNKLHGVTATTNELNKLSGLTSTTNELNILTGVTATYSEINVLDGILATTAELNYLSTTQGEANANKALILDLNKNISGINNLSAMNITGTLLTSSQPNITSVGSLTNLIATGSVNITNNTISTSPSSGALIVSGGVGIGGSLNVNGNIIGTLETSIQPNITKVGILTELTSTGVVNITNTTNTTTASTGALIISGGVGIGGALNVNGNINIDSSLNVNGNIVGTLTTSNQPNITSIGTLTNLTSSGIINITNATQSTNSLSGALVVTGGVGIGGALNVSGNITGTLITSNQPNITSIGTLTNLTSYGIVNITDTTNSTNASTGALIVSGGVGIGGALNVSGNITGALATSSQPNITSIGTLTNLTSTGIVNITNTSISNSVSTGALIVSGGVGIGGALNVSGNITGTLATSSQPNITSVGTLTSLNSSGAVNITNTTVSSSTSTGALIVSGGVGIGGALNVSGNIAGTLSTASQPNITSIGTLTSLTSSGVVNITNETATTSPSTGALIISGGVGIGGGLNVTGNITGTLTTSNQPNITSIGTLTNLNSSGAVIITDTTVSTSTSTGALIVSGGVGIGGALNVTGNITGTLTTSSQPNITSIGTLTSLTSNGNVNITNTTVSTSASTGALIVSGGVGISGALNVTGNITGTLSTSSQPNITSIGTLTGLTLSGACTTSFANNTNTMVLYTGWTNTANTLDTRIIMSNTMAMLGTNSNHPLGLMTNGIERIRLDTNGNIGIGITNPQYRLDISGDINITGSFRVNGTVLSTSSSTTSTDVAKFRSRSFINIDTYPENLTVTFQEALSAQMESVKNSDYYDYANTGDSTAIDDGGRDMYDGGNYIRFTVDGVSSSFLPYTQTTAATTTVNGKSITWLASGKTSPFFICATSETSMNFGIRVSGSIGADGGGSYQFRDILNSTEQVGSNTYYIYSVANQMWGSGDPTICQLWISIRRTAYTSSMGSGSWIDTSTNPRDTIDNTFLLSGTSGCLHSYILLSATNSQEISTSTLIASTRAFVLAIDRMGLYASTFTSQLNSNISIHHSTPLYKLMAGNINLSRVTTNNIIAKNKERTAKFIGGWGFAGFWGLGFDSSLSSVRLGECNEYGEWTGSRTNLVVQSINYSGSLISDSDYRLKKDVEPLNYGLRELMLLNPLKYKMILDNHKIHFGFIAHEVQNIIPELVTGNKDENDNNNNPKYQSLDYIKLIPILINSIKELNTIVNTLIIKVSNQEQIIQNLINQNNNN